MKAFEDEKGGRNMLLFHGSSFTNFLGLLSMGLQIGPPTIDLHGSKFGKGVYFADMFTKSADYCDDESYETRSLSRYILVCEVAIGKCKEMINGYNEDDIGSKYI